MTLGDETRYREIEVGGKPRQMGQAIGEAAKEEIRGFVDVALERVNLTTPVTTDKAMKLARDCIPYAEEYGPDSVEELKGTAEASGVTFEDLMMLQVRNQLKPEEEAGCTSFSIAPVTNQNNHFIIGQNWDNDPALDPFTVVLKRRPEGKPALMNITQAGLIGYIGLNEAGIGICLNTLPAPSRDLGVPHYFQVREIYQKNSLDGAIESVRRAYRAIPANICLSTPQGPADLEVTINDVHVLRDETNRIVTHTNHCVHTELLPINDEFPELIESHARIARIDKLLSEPAGPLALDHLKAALSDHEDHPRSICRHVNAHPHTGYWVSVFSVIIEADDGVMHISRGNPCERPYETYRLN